MQQDHVVTGTVTAVTETESQIGEGLAAAATAPPRSEREAARRKRRRELGRVRKERHTARKREKARLAAIAEAERLEAETKENERRAEKLAPAVLREPIVAPAVKPTSWRPAGRPEMTLLGPRVQIVDGRPVRAFCVADGDDPIIKLARENKAFTQRHTEAARQLQLDWEDVGGGLGLGAVDYLRTGGGGGSGAINQAMLDQALVRVRLDGAMAYLGAFAPAVARIVLDCVPVRVWAEQAGKTPPDAAAWLAAALERLAGFYWPADTRTGRPRILTIGPPRSTYGTGFDCSDGAPNA